MIGLRTRVRKQPIIALIFESETELKFYNLEVRSYSLVLNKESYISAYVLLNLLNDLKIRDKMRGLLSILSHFRNEFYKFNKREARVLDCIYHMTLKLIKICIFGL